jgi:TetR/AcrR family transcriptional repressor of mexJK operon
MNSRAQGREVKREQIRSAAAVLFLKHGFASTSMDGVTSRAGVSKETVYRYYSSKEELFADVLRQLIADPVRLEGADPEKPCVQNWGDLEELLVSRSERYLARVLEPDQLSLLQVVISEGSRFPDLVEAFRGTLPATGGALIIGALEAGRAAGLVGKQLDLRTAARAFAGLLMMFILRDGLLAGEPRRPERRHLVAMVRLFIHGIAGERGRGD